MYSEGLIDLMEIIMFLPLTPPADMKNKLEGIETKATGRYLPVFEKVPQRHGIHNNKGEVDVSFEGKCLLINTCLKCSKSPQSFRMDFLVLNIFQLSTYLSADPKEGVTIGFEILFTQHKKTSN